MLQRILHFQHQPAAGAAAGPGESWLSGWALDPGERYVVEAVLQHREGALLHGEDDLQPIPPGATARCFVGAGRGGVGRGGVGGVGAGRRWECGCLREGCTWGACNGSWSDRIKQSA